MKQKFEVVDKITDFFGSIDEVLKVVKAALSGFDAFYRELKGGENNESK